MGGLFSKPKVEKPEAPKPVRMPVQTDPAIEQAAQRTRQAAMLRQGRMSTILTDSTRATGSSGQKLGA
jgi:hypothetical protein